MIVPVRDTFRALTEHHYLGPTKTALFAWQDRWGCMVFSTPGSRRLPQHWLELVRWCLNGERNGGSQQWASFVRWARNGIADNITTFVSYSDPSRGHTGALYKACNWQWAPTWHRLRPPPSGNGKWSDSALKQSVKDRWVFPLRDDEARGEVLRIKDDAIIQKIQNGTITVKGLQT